MMLRSRGTYVRSFPLFVLLLLALLVSIQPGQARQADIHKDLQALKSLTGDALKASQAAENARSVEEIKRHADAVFIAVWGLPSGLTNPGAMGASTQHGWKTVWQKTYADFGEDYAKRYSALPPEITDATKLGIVGQGRQVRRDLQQIIDNDGSSDAQKRAAEKVISSMNNVIGWTVMQDGVTKAERQPRIDLTRVWDAGPNARVTRYRWVTDEPQQTGTK